MMSWRKTNISQPDKGLLACCHMCKAGPNVNNPPLPLPLFFPLSASTPLAGACCAQAPLCCYNGLGATLAHGS